VIQKISSNASPTPSDLQVDSWTALDKDEGMEKYQRAVGLQESDILMQGSLDMKKEA
jgi:hypothetical protein